MTKLVLLGSCWVAAILSCPPASLPGSNVTPKGQLSMKSNYFDVIYFAKNGLFYVSAICLMPGTCCAEREFEVHQSLKESGTGILHFQRHERGC